ncbi:Copine-2, partial [Dissophora globulifera]
YMILLILTDGIISDLDDTLCAINEACDAPLSIIIVGVGNANFGAMSQLDGDNEEYSGTSGEKSSKQRRRDIVQFVAAKDYRPDQPHLLAEALLAEVPRQFMEYMKTTGTALSALAPRAHPQMVQNYPSGQVLGHTYGTYSQLNSDSPQSMPRNPLREALADPVQGVTTNVRPRGPQQNYSI